MLASLMPGFRDLRVPLSSGLLLVAASWILLGQFVPTREQATGLVEQTYVLMQALGAPALLASLTFVSYVLGILAVYITANYWPLNRLMHTGDIQASAYARTDTYVRTEVQMRHLTMDQARAVQTSLRAGTPRSYDDEMFERYEGNEFGSRYDGDPQRAIEAIYGNLRAAVLNDIPSTAVRLQATHKDLYDTYDRIDAEAQFRYAIALPMPICVLALGLRLSDLTWLLMVPAALLAIAIGYLLIKSARSKRLESSDALMQAVFVGIVTPQAIETAKAAVKRLRDEEKDPA